MTNRETFFQEAKHLFATGHPKESIALFTRAEEEGCNPVNIHMSRGAAYMALGEYENAFEDFSLVLDIDIDNERALYFKGISLLNLGRFEEAVNDLTRSISLNHERGTAFLARALAFSELGRDEESVRDLKTAVAFSGVEVESFLNKYGSNRTLFEKYMALLDGDRGPVTMVLNDEEVEKINRFVH